jgi:hypothetical protein
MSSIFNLTHRQAKMRRILEELDQEQVTLSAHCQDAAEDLRLACIFLSSALRTTDLEIRKRKSTKHLTDART